MNRYTKHLRLPLQKLITRLLIVFISISAIYLLSPTLHVHAGEMNAGTTTGTVQAIDN